RGCFSQVPWLSKMRTIPSRAMVPNAGLLVWIKFRRRLRAAYRFAACEAPSKNGRPKQTRGPSYHLDTTANVGGPVPAHGAAPGVRIDRGFSRGCRPAIGRLVNESPDPEQNGPLPTRLR